MAHLSDQSDSTRVIFNLEPGETFIAFVDKFLDSQDASIGILMYDADGQLVYRLYKYRNPF